MDLNDEKIIELIKPYQEKIKKLQEEISQKELEITQLKFKLYQYNNDNQQINNSKNQMINSNLSDNNYLVINMEFENGPKVSVQCKTNDKLEVPIQHFLNLTMIKKEDYDFIIMKRGKKIKLNSTVKENGLIDKDYYILVKKKSNDENQENESSSDDDELNYNNKILGTPINIIFKTNSGMTCAVQSGKENIFKDLAIKYSQKINESPSFIKKNAVFIYNGQKIKFNNDRTLEQLGLKEGNIVSVVYL